MSTQTIPMFPLGTNVFPLQILPLHVFEERYRQMMRDVLDSVDKSFGVVMIERGRETGGGDVRSNIATRVEILEAEEFEDGRWGVVVAGVERLDVAEWLDDDPYPQAVVAVRDRRDTGGASLDGVRDLLGETLTVGAELVGVDVPDLEQLSTDPLERLDQMSAIAPLTTFDRQAILSSTTTGEQIERLTAALHDKLALLRDEADRRSAQ